MALERLSMVPWGQPPHAPSRPEADIAALMLGPLEVDVAGRRVLRWNSLKARAVFQYLLIHRSRPVRRDVLMELEWPDHTHTSARNNLNVALHSLRNTLDGPWQSLQPVLYQDGCYALNPKLKWWVDRDEFLSDLSQAGIERTSSHLRHAVYHYQRAIQLYRGPLFEDDLAVTGTWPSKGTWPSFTYKRLKTWGRSILISGSLLLRSIQASWRSRGTRAVSPCTGC